MKVIGTNIYMTRGDSETITVSLRQEGAEIPLVEGDTIYFTVKTNSQTEDKVIQKVVTTFDDGKAIISILPEDTKYLPFTTFVYDVQLTRADGSVITIIKPSEFVVEEEVTYE